MRWILFLIQERLLRNKETNKETKKGKAKTRQAERAVLTREILPT